jgi:DNA-binding phage protein
MTAQTKTASFHDRRLKRQMQDPEFKAEYERQLRAIKAVDELVNAVDGLREENNLSKAEVARMIDKNPASVRRPLTASGNPELKTVIAMADVLGADVKIVPRNKG